MTVGYGSQAAQSVWDDPALWVATPDDREAWRRACALPRHPHGTLVLSTKAPAAITGAFVKTSQTRLAPL